jgi:hypothetical protein
MAKNIRKIAQRLGATVAGQIPDVGGGAFGAARLAAILSARLTPSQGKRPGRPTVAGWDRHPKVPMSRRTLKRLETLAARMSSADRKVSPMQVAAQLLEESLDRFVAAEPGGPSTHN